MRTHKTNSNNSMVSAEWFFFLYLFEWFLALYITIRFDYCLNWHHFNFYAHNYRLEINNKKYNKKSVYNCVCPMSVSWPIKKKVRVCKHFIKIYSHIFFFVYF